MLTTKTLLSLGAAFAGTKLAQSISRFDVGQVLGGVGLARRRTHIPESLAYLGVGVFIGGVAALLLAPSSGAETREKLAEKVDSLGDAASRKLREAQEETHDIADRLSHDVSIGHSI